MKHRVLSFLMLLGVGALSAIGHAQTVSVTKGNLYLTTRTGRVQLTTSGRDREPALSPDKKRVVFVRAVPQRAGATENTSELWVSDVATKRATLLVQGRAANDPKHNLTNFQVPQFAPDGQRVYFLTSAWVTSDAVHAVNIASRAISFVCASNALEVVPRGEYKGCLIVQQHRYFLGGGSFDWYYLMRPNGAEVGPLGETTANFKETYLS